MTQIRVFITHPGFFLLTGAIQPIHYLRRSEVTKETFVFYNARGLQQYYMGLRGGPGPKFM